MLHLGYTRRCNFIFAHRIWLDFLELEFRQGQTFFSAPERSDRLLGPPSLLFTRLSPVPRLEMNGAMPPQHIQGQLLPQRKYDFPCSNSHERHNRSIQFCQHLLHRRLTESDKKEAENGGWGWGESHLRPLVKYGFHRTCCHETHNR